MNLQETEKPQINPWLTRLIYPFGSFFILPFYFQKLEIEGQENIPKSDAVIIAPTHRSRWDALVVPYATGILVSKRDLYFMVSDNEIKGLQGWFISRLGGFGVNTEKPDLSSFRQSIDILKDGNMMVIFPEGNIIRSQEVAPLKLGVARIALDVASKYPQVNTKILPVSVKYSQEFPTFGSEVKLKIGKPIDVSKYNQNSLKKESVILTKDLEKSLKLLHEN